MTAVDYAGWELERQRAALAALLLGGETEERRENRAVRKAETARLSSAGGQEQRTPQETDWTEEPAGSLLTPAGPSETTARPAGVWTAGGRRFLWPETGSLRGSGGTGALLEEGPRAAGTGLAEGTGTAERTAEGTGTAEEIKTAESGAEEGQAAPLRTETFDGMPGAGGGGWTPAASLRSSAGSWPGAGLWAASGGGEEGREAAKTLSLAVQRDARRYDGGFALY